MAESLSVFTSSIDINDKVFYSASDWIRVSVLTPCSGIVVGTGTGAGVELQPGVKYDFDLSPGDKLVARITTDLASGSTTFIPTGLLQVMISPLPWTEQFLLRLDRIIERRSRG